MNDNEFNLRHPPKTEQDILDIFKMWLDSAVMTAAKSYLLMKAGEPTSWPTGKCSLRGCENEAGRYAVMFHHVPIEDKGRLRPVCDSCVEKAHRVWMETGGEGYATVVRIYVPSEESATDERIKSYVDGHLADRKARKPTSSSHESYFVDGEVSALKALRREFWGEPES